MPRKKVKWQGFNSGPKTPEQRAAHTMKSNMGKLEGMAMPAGYSVSWRLINKGTVLEGTAYPHPVAEFSRNGGAAF